MSIHALQGPIALIPGHKVPDLNLSTADGGSWDLQKNAGENFTLLTFYRGYHCPKCREQLQDLQSQLAEFEATGTRVVGVSMDPQDRAEKSVKDWEVDKVTIGYGLTADEAKAWGLHMSSSRGKTSVGVEELKVFNEPGLFLIRSDGTLYASWVQTVPFGRSKAADLVSMIKFVLDKDYPPRGTLVEG
ncbi:MAG: peroxiredoxin-like family protein [Pseudomonadota bacterium]